MPSSGKYSHRIAPANDRVRIQKKIAAMAKINTPQWNKPMVGSPQDSTGRWFDTQINYWYGLGGVEAVMKEV
jgi:hypothetical protein